MKTALLLLLVLPTYGTTLLRIACGGSTAGATDEAGNFWSSDAQYVVGGTPYPVAGQKVPYQSLRYTAKMMGFSIPMPNAAYKVTVKFIEPRTITSTPPAVAGQRVFDVLINGIVMIQNLDLFVVAGGLSPKDYTFPITVTTGAIVVSTTAKIGNAVLSGIQIDDVFVPPPPPSLMLPPATFATPPVSPLVYQAFLFTDAHPIDNCAPGGDGGTPQLCYWNGTIWQSLAPVQPSIMTAVRPGRRAIRQLDCQSGIVDKSLLTADAPNQEVPILDNLNGSARYDHVTICERERFMGQNTITVSMGRPGSNNFELSGTVLPLGVSANNQGCWTALPSPPQLSGAYSIVLNFAVAPGAVKDISAGSVEWEVCAFPSLIGDPGVIGTTKLAGLEQCSGSGVGWDCAGLLRATVKRADGSLLPIVGTGMTVTPTAAVTWTPIK